MDDWLYILFVAVIVPLLSFFGPKLVNRIRRTEDRPDG